MKAKLLQTLVLNGKAQDPGNDDAPRIVELSQKEFKRLEAMGVVSEPSERDLKLAVDDSEDSYEGVDDDDAAQAAAEAEAKAKAEAEAKAKADQAAKSNSNKPKATGAAVDL